MISVRTKLYFSMENLILQQFFVFTFPERHDKMCSYLYFSFLRGQTMDSNFFALISRMRYIARWGLMRNALPENIQEHSHMVAVLAHALGVIRRDIFHQPCDVNALATAALYHDASEILTGDLPTPIWDITNVFWASRQLKPITLQQDVFTKVLLTKNAVVTIWERLFRLSPISPMRSNAM